ncbi:MAG: hypothetical protein ACOVNU_03880 [Candidatus Kapaibacteriota bacterium]|jgi:hypothetical protein
MEQNSTNLGEDSPKEDGSKNNSDNSINDTSNNNSNNQNYSNQNYSNQNTSNNFKGYKYREESKVDIIKPKSVFWGTLFFLVGLIVLLSNLNIHLDIYQSKFIDFWPLLLIMYGISFFKLPLIVKQINASLGAILIVVLILNMFNTDYNWVNIVKKSKFIKINTNNDDDQNQNLSEYQDVKQIILDSNYKKAHFTMNAGAGDFKLFSTKNEYLIEVKSNTEMDFGKLYTSQDTNFKKYDVIYKTFTDKNENKNVDIDENDFDRKIDFILSENTLWTIESNIGAGEFDYDLTNINFDSLEINAGAAEIKIKVGEKIEKSYLNINSGATEIKIKIPKNIGCQIITKTALTENNFKNFIRIDDDLYETQSFNKSTKKLYITIDGGISSYNVETY